MFRALGNLVMHGRGGVNGGAPYGAPYGRGHTPMQYPVPPVYPTARTEEPPVVNPAVREAEVKGAREDKEAAEVNGRRKWHGSRKAYISSIGVWPTKAELLDLANRHEESMRRDNSIYPQHSPEELEKSIKRHKFSLMKQYKLSKHEPTGMPSHPFGEMIGGAASKFYYGSSPDVKGWRWMKPEEQDAMMATESDAVNMPRIATQQAERRQAADNQRYAQQARQAAEQWANLPPAEREMITYNRQLAEYNEAVQRNQHLEMVQQQQQQQNQQPNFGPQMGDPMVSPVMLDNLAMMMQGENTRYMPVRPRRSINERIMSSFDPRMFSPEFIPEEENGY